MVAHKNLSNAVLNNRDENKYAEKVFNDNLTSVPLAGPVVLPFLPLAKFNFDILILLEGLVLHSIAFNDASRCGVKKKMKKFG